VVFEDTAIKDLAFRFLDQNAEDKSHSLIFAVPGARKTRTVRQRKGRELCGCVSSW
jgi:hypothetical protein